MATYVSTLVLVEAVKLPQPKFKLHPMKDREINMTGALSSMPSSVLLVEYIHSFIHCNIEELRDKFIRHEFKGFCDHDLLKAKYSHMKTKGLSNVADFSNQFYANWVRYVLSRVRDQFLWLEAEAPIRITKDVSQRVTGFSATGEALTLRTISSTKVTRLTQSRCDRREMPIAHIEDAKVRFAFAVLGYRSINQAA